MMKQLIYAAVLVGLTVWLTPGTAGADPTPEPSPATSSKVREGRRSGVCEACRRFAGCSRGLVQGTGIQIQELGSFRRDPSRRLNK